MKKTLTLAAAMIGLLPTLSWAASDVAPFPSDGCKPGYDGTNFIDANNRPLAQQDGLYVGADKIVRAASGAIVILRDGCLTAAAEDDGEGGGNSGAAIGALVVLLGALAAGSSTSGTTGGTN